MPWHDRCTVGQDPHKIPEAQFPPDRPPPPDPNPLLRFAGPARRPSPELGLAAPGPA